MGASTGGSGREAVQLNPVRPIPLRMASQERRPSGHLTHARRFARALRVAARRIPTLAVLAALSTSACADAPSAPSDPLASMGRNAAGSRRAVSVCVPGPCDGSGMLAVTGIVPSAESEPNNVLSAANSLTLRATADAGPVAAVSASLASAFDVDVFQVDLPPAPVSRRYVAELVAQRLSPSAGPVTILEQVAPAAPDPDGLVVQSAERCESTATADPCLSIAVPAAESGTRLHFRVRARANSAGRYTLLLRRM